MDTGVVGFPDAKLVKKTVTYDYKNPTLHFEFKDVDVYEFSLQREVIDKELIDLKNQYFKYEITDNQKKYNGTFWVYRKNCFLCPQSDDVYIYVVRVNDDNIVETLRFEIDGNSQLSIEEEKIYSITALESQYEQVSKEEISNEWFKVRALLDMYNRAFE